MEMKEFTSGGFAGTGYDVVLARHCLSGLRAESRLRNLSCRGNCHGVCGVKGSLLKKTLPVGWIHRESVAAGAIFTIPAFYFHGRDFFRPGDAYWKSRR